MMSVAKFWGCVMMIVGSAIGAGILAMPMISASSGFTATFMMVASLCVLQTITGLLVIEATVALPDNACSFDSISKKTLGAFGRFVTWFSYVLVLYSNLAAYIAGGPDLVVTLLKNTSFATIPHWLIVVLFVLVLGMAVFWSTEATDFMNRGLMSIKGLLLITCIVLLSIYIDPYRLFSVPSTAQVGNVLFTSAILLNLFNYHFIVPSIRMYIGNKPQILKKILIVATTICLILYTLWLAIILSIVPLNGENSFAVIGGSTGELSRVITILVNNKWVNLCVHGFANVTMTTSFLGVSLGLFDFLADWLKRPNTRFGRLQTAMITFMPPLLLNIFIPNSKNFLRYFGCSGIFVAILFVVLPPLMIYRLRRIPELAQNSSYRVKIGNMSFVVIFTLGVILALFAAVAVYRS